MTYGKTPIDQEWILSALFLKKGRVLVEGVSGCEDRGLKGTKPVDLEWPFLLFIYVSRVKGGKG